MFCTYFTYLTSGGSRSPKYLSCASIAAGSRNRDGFANRAIGPPGINMNMAKLSVITRNRSAMEYRVLFIM